MTHSNTKKILAFISLTLLLSTSMAQTGGNQAYKFLNLTNSPRVAALGGNFLSISDNDILLTLSNPSLIKPSMSKNLGFSFVDYYTDVNYGFAIYSHDFKNLGTYTAAFQYGSYGDFTYADETGSTGGTFKANDLAFNLGWARALDSNFSIGANLKFIHSSMETYTSYGVGVDVAGTYHKPETGFSVSLIGRNIGTQLKPYVSGQNEALPFELQLGLSNKLKHLPFRYSILLTNLQKWDLTYVDPNDPNQQYDPITNQPVEKTEVGKFFDKSMRHIVIGGEFLPFKSLAIRAGYNYQRRKELGVSSRMSTVGFSWGVGIKISKFQINYARSAYHLSGSPNFISITTNLSSFSKNQ